MAATMVRSPDGRLNTADELEQRWRERIQQAREHRKRHEPTWLSNLAFAAGKHWLVWDERHRQLRHIADVDARYAGQELYTADKINEHVQAQLGELESDDDRPELLLAQDGDAAEEIQKELNELVAHGWEYEWGADSALTQARRLCLKLGVSAIRVRFDPNRGPVTAHVPIGQDGQPVLDEASLQHLEQSGQLPDGSLPQFKPVREGQTIFEPLSALNLLTPPGVNHEDAFPWEIVVRPVPLDQVKDNYGAAAAELREDGDIGSIIGVTTSQTAARGEQNSGRLRGQVWLFTCYERPSVANPQGQVAILASGEMKLVHVEDTLPVKGCDGEYGSGVHYLHWWRLDDGFWSRSFIEPLKDPQRLINRRETQNAETIDRGQAKVFVKEGTLVHNPSGMPLEVVEIKGDAPEPNFFAGIGPGAWMYEDLAHHADNMAHASTLSPLRLGENPANVDTYAQLALLNENEAAKRSTILQEHKRSIAGCVEDGVYMIRRYWPAEKQILVGGDDDKLTQQVFAKSKIPDFYVVRPARGSAKPRSQGAELTKIDAIWQAAVACGVATSPVSAPKWIDWYAKSLDAGQALELPDAESDSQVDMARFENFLMLDQGETVQPADYDLLPVHVPIHREAQNQARAASDLVTYQRIEQHIQASIQLAQANALKVAAAQQAPSPSAPPAAGQPGGTPVFPPHLLPPAPAPAAP